jgi:hypothetical protein
MSARSLPVEKINTMISGYNSYVCNSFSAFIEYITKNELFTKVVENDRFFLTFGGGGPPPSFPKELLIGEHTTYIFAFDTEFQTRHKALKFLQYISKRGHKIELYTIATTVPEVNDVRQVAKNTYALQKEGSTFLYYNTAKCSIDDTDENKLWISQFTELIEMINKTRQNVFIVNDAWWDQNNIFGRDLNVHSKLSIKNIKHLGRNFEVLCIIPKIVLSSIDPSKLFMIVPSADNIPIVFTLPEAVHKYTAIETTGKSFTLQSNLNYLASLPENSEAEPKLAACGGAGNASCALPAPRRGGSRRHIRRRKQTRRRR